MMHNVIMPGMNPKPRAKVGSSVCNTNQKSQSEIKFGWSMTLVVPAESPNFLIFSFKIFSPMMCVMWRNLKFLHICHLCDEHVIL